MPDLAQLSDDELAKIAGVSLKSKTANILPDEETFQGWYGNWAKKSGMNINPDDPLHQYDYRAAYKAGVVPPEPGGHWPSKYKMPGHPNRYVEGHDTLMESMSDDELANIAGVKLSTEPKESLPSKVGKYAVGAAEAGTNLVQQAFTFLPSGLAYLGGLPFGRETAEKAMEKTANIDVAGTPLVYQPVTEEGKQIASLIPKGLEWAGEKAGKVGEWTGIPYAEPFLKSLPASIAVLLGAKGLMKGMKPKPIPEPKPIMPIIETIPKAEPMGEQPGLVGTDVNILPVPEMAVPMGEVPPLSTFQQMAPPLQRPVKPITGDIIPPVPPGLQGMKAAPRVEQKALPPGAYEMPAPVEQLPTGFEDFVKAQVEKPQAVPPGLGKKAKIVEQPIGEVAKPSESTIIEPMTPKKGAANIPPEITPKAVGGKNIKELRREQYKGTGGDDEPLIISTGSWKKFLPNPSSPPEVGGRVFAPPESTPSPKQPWEMTDAEIKDLKGKTLGEIGGFDITQDLSAEKSFTFLDFPKKGSEILADTDKYGMIGAERKWGIESKLRKGEKIPPEVLKDYPELIEKPIISIAKSAQERWDSAKLGKRLEWVKKAGWFTNQGKLSKLGEKITQTNWKELSTGARNPLERYITEDYPELKAGGWAKEREARVFKETQDKFAEEAASTETITEREARRLVEQIPVRKTMPTLAETNRERKGLIPPKLESLAQEARKYGSVEEWKSAIGKEPRGVTSLGPAALSPLSLKGGAVKQHGFKSLTDFYNQAIKGTGEVRERSPIYGVEENLSVLANLADQHSNAESFAQSIRKSEFRRIGLYESLRPRQTPTVSEGNIITTTLLPDVRYKVLEVSSQKILLKRIGATTEVSIKPSEVATIIKGEMESTREFPIKKSFIDDELKDWGYKNLEDFYAKYKNSTVTKHKSIDEVIKEEPTTPPENTELFKNPEGGFVSIDLGAVRTGVRQGIIGKATYQVKNILKEPAGKEILSSIDKADVGHHTAAGTYREIMNKAGFGKLSKEADEIFTFVAEGRGSEVMERFNKLPIDQKALVGEAVKAWETTRKSIFQRAATLGTQVLEETGKRRLIREVDNFLPRKLSDTVKDAMGKDVERFYEQVRKQTEKLDIENPEARFQQAAEKVWADWQAKQTTLDPVTQQAVDFMVSKGLRPAQAMRVIYGEMTQDLTGYYGHLERARTAPMLPDSFYERSGRKLVTSYIEGANKRLAEIEQWGPNSEKLAEMINRIKDPTEREIASKVVRMYTGAYGQEMKMNPALDKLMNEYFMNYEVASKIGLGTSTIPNIVQPLISSVFRNGMIKSLQGIKLLADKDMRSIIRGSGTNSNLMIKMLSGEIKEGHFQRVVDQFMHYHPFTGVNAFNNYLSASTAFVDATSLAKIAKQGSIFPGRTAWAARRLNKFYNIEAKNIKANGVLSEQQMKEVMFRAARDEQLQHNILKDPFYANDPRFRSLYLFKRFGYKQFNMIREHLWDEVTHGNPLPILRLVAAGYIGGGFVLEAKHLLTETGKWIASGGKDGIEFWRKQNPKFLNEMINRMTATGTLGFLTDLARPDPKGKLSAEQVGKNAAFLTTPVIGQEIKRGIEYAQGMGAPLKTGKKALKEQIPLARYLLPYEVEKKRSNLRRLKED